MKIKRALSAVLAFATVCCAIVGFLHLLNEWIFRRVVKTGNPLIWKSEFGDIAFTREGEGRPVLFVHGIGIGAGSAEWSENVKALAKSHCVYTIDLPGFGNSEKRKTTYNSYFYAKVINTFALKIIGRKSSVIVSDISAGFVLAGAKFMPNLFGKIIIVNPYAEGMGAKYKKNPFVKKILAVPVIGTLVYNFISSKQSILSFLDSAVPLTEGYSEVARLMEKKYENAHLYGTNNKYAVSSFINGYLDTDIYSLVKNCEIPLCVIVGGGGERPFMPVYEGIAKASKGHGEFYPNIYASDEFNEVVQKFIKNRAYS